MIKPRALVANSTECLGKLFTIEPPSPALTANEIVLTFHARSLMH
jgi:hypothetical protein